MGAGYTASVLPVMALAAAAFIFLALLAATVAAHWRTRTPYGGTPRAVGDAMIRLAELRPGERVCDIGAGDGRLLIAAKRACPGIEAVGYENAPAVWLCGKLRIWLSGEEVSLRLRDARRDDLSGTDVSFLYVGPEMMRELLPKLMRELRPGSRAIASVFPFHGKEPVKVEEVRGKKIYVYGW